MMNHPFFEETDDKLTLNHDTLFALMETEEECLTFLQAVQVIPQRNEPPPCPLCGSLMRDEDQTIAWVWRCRKRRCSGFVNPLTNTFFEGLNFRLLDVLGLMANFVDKIEFEEAWDNARFWRWVSRVPDDEVPKEIVKKVYDRCRRVCHIIMDQEQDQKLHTIWLYLMYKTRILDNPDLTSDLKFRQFLIDVILVYPGNGITGLNFKNLE